MNSTNSVNNSTNSKKKHYIQMHCALCMLSFSGVFAKFAAQSEWFSFKWFAFYGIVFLILGLYAIVWQRVLKGIPLTVAFSNKAITLFWGMVWGALLFQEHISLRMILGALIIFGGILIISTEETERKEAGGE